MAPLTTWSQARDVAFATGRPLPAAARSLASAHGCVLAAPMTALTPLPSFDTAAMDGWAVRGHGPWTVIGRTLAGASVARALQRGEAVEVATGAQVPPGTEGVLPYEQGQCVAGLLTGPDVGGRHVRRAGEECKAADILLPAGAVLSSAALALAAVAGHDTLDVHPRPRVHGLVTGDELLLSGRPGEGRTRDAIGPLLPGAVLGCGGQLTQLDHLPDDRDVLAKALFDADADVIVTSGASSVGPADFLLVALVDLGADVLVHGVQVKPGHPQILARLQDGRTVIGLPGNPLAALVGVVTLLAPLLAGLTGRAIPELRRVPVLAPLEADRTSTRLVPVTLTAQGAEPTGHGGAAMLRGAARADAFAVVPAGRTCGPGDAVVTVAMPGGF